MRAIEVEQSCIINSVDNDLPVGAVEHEHAKVVADDSAGHRVFQSLTYGQREAQATLPACHFGVIFGDIDDMWSGDRLLASLSACVFPWELRQRRLGMQRHLRAAHPQQ